jgi:glucose/arabinose dehydrogenase
MHSEPAYAAAPAGFSDRLLTGGLNLPVSMEFSPDGRLFVSEKDGSLRVIKDGVLLDEPFASLAVNSEGERGLLGIAFDPNFTSNGYVYVYYTTETEPIHNRVSRLTADPVNPDRALAGSELSILDLEPLTTVSHNGGGLEFGPDGALYISTGDNYFPYLAESLTSRFGKILRINADGSIPTDNPFYNVQGAYREIWALGLRNPFSFAFSPSGQTLYINDVGQDAWEEINIGSAGANYGWPTCEGACNDSQFTDPVYSYRHASNGGGASITGGAFYEAGQFPSEYLGSYFFGDYTSGFIKRLTPDNEAMDFLTNIIAPVDVKVGPDGHLYYLSIVSGEVREVLFTTQGNYDPIAVVNANQTRGLAPLSVSFDASESTDPNSEDTLAYSWNFGDGSATAGQASVMHTYNSSGLYTATVTVNDGNGGSSTASIDITVGNPPVATINTPASGATYNAGDAISFSGSATDEEDGILPASAFHWTVLFHHNVHTHPFQEYSGVSSGSFTIPTVGETDDNVWYRIYLTVTDSSGLRHNLTRDIVPNTSTVTVTSNVTGLQLLLDGQPRTSPHTFTGVAGTQRTVEAPTAQILSGSVYTFDSWSDGGEQSHTITTPQDDETLTAYYVEGSSSQHTLAIRSEDLSGNELTGRYATIESPRGTILADGFTPLDFTGYQGIQYTVIIRDHGGSTFDRWENNDTTRVRTLTFSNDTEITAFYRTISGESSPTPAQPTAPADPPEVFDLTVNAVDLSGNALAVHATIESSSNGEVMHEGDTPLNYTSSAGNSYQVTVQDADDIVFDRWDDNSTNRTRTLVLDSDMPITAYMNVTQASDSGAEEDTATGSAGAGGSSSGGSSSGGSSSGGSSSGGSSSGGSSSGGSSSGGSSSGGSSSGGSSSGGSSSGGSSSGGSSSGGSSSGGSSSGGSSSGGSSSGGSSSGGSSGIIAAPPTGTYPPPYFTFLPLAKVLLQSTIFDGENSNSSRVNSGEQITISTNFRNVQQVAQDYAVIIQIQDSRGITRDVDWETGSLQSGETASASKSWTAEEDDEYTVKIFVWDGIDQAPTPLADVKSETVAVG